MQKHSQHNNDELTQLFRKIYLSHFIRNGCKGVMREGWAGDRTKLQNIDPQLFWLLQLFFLVLLGCLTGGPEGRKPSVWSWFSCWHLICKTLTPTNWTSCRTGLYHCLPSTCFLWASHLHPTQPVYSQGYPLISSTGCTCHLHRSISYLTAQPGRRSICYTVRKFQIKKIYLTHR